MKDFFFFFTFTIGLEEEKKYKRFHEDYVIQRVFKEENKILWIQP